MLLYKLLHGHQRCPYCLHSGLVVMLWLGDQVVYIMVSSEEQDATTDTDSLLLQLFDTVESLLEAHCDAAAHLQVLGDAVAQ